MRRLLLALPALLLAAFPALAEPIGGKAMLPSGSNNTPVTAENNILQDKITAGEYQWPQLIVNAKGVITGISSGTAPTDTLFPCLDPADSIQYNHLGAFTCATIDNGLDFTGGTLAFKALFNDQSGGDYTVLTGDRAKTTRVGAHTYTLPQAGTTGFASGWGACFLNTGSGDATLTTTTSTFKGATGSTSVTIPQNTWACPESDGTDYITTRGGGVGDGSGDGSVTSVALSVPATSIFGVTGSPVTTSGTLGLTTTGTSGGVPYFSSGSVLSSSGALAANGFVLGGGAGSAPTASQITGLVLGAGSSAPGAYAGASCTNQFPRSTNASGAWTCATVGAADVSLADLTATDTTLTFSGTYNGSTARTIGLNLGNNNSWTKGQAVAPTALTSGATVNVDASLSNDFTLTAAHTFTLANPTNLLAGQTLNFWITQDGTGSRVMTLGSQYQAAGGTSSLVLSTAASAKDLLTCVSDTTSTMTCALLKAIAH